MAFLKSIASVFQPREVKVVRERQERSVKVTHINRIKMRQWMKVKDPSKNHPSDYDRPVLTLVTVQFSPLESFGFLFEELSILQVVHFKSF